MDINLEKTQNGFFFSDFKDANEEPCSIQESSATDPHIWFGRTNNAPNHQFTNEPISPRMHLSQAQVKKLLPLLEHFAETGELENFVAEENNEQQKVRQTSELDTDVVAIAYSLYRQVGCPNGDTFVGFKLWYKIAIVNAFEKFASRESQ